MTGIKYSNWVGEIGHISWLNPFDRMSWEGFSKEASYILNYESKTDLMRVRMTVRKVKVKKP